MTNNYEGGYAVCMTLQERKLMKIWQRFMAVMLLCLKCWQECYQVFCTANGSILRNALKEFKKNVEDTLILYLLTCMAFLTMHCALLSLLTHCTMKNNSIRFLSLRNMKKNLFSYTKIYKTSS